MSAAARERALRRLAACGGVLAPLSRGAGYGVFAGADRRRRPLARLSAEQVRALAACGAVVAAGEHVFTLADAGSARVRRESAAPGEGFLAQHAPVIDKPVVREGGVACVRGFDGEGALRRLAALRDAAGRPWLSGAELEAAHRLRADWHAAQAGLVHGSDWSAPPKGGAACGPGNAQERALAARCDARRRLADALAALAAPLRRAVERACLDEQGLDAIERAEGWPARSGKLALKLGLAQLALALL